MAHTQQLAELWHSNTAWANSLSMSFTIAQTQGEHHLWCAAAGSLLHSVSKREPDSLDSKGRVKPWTAPAGMHAGMVNECMGRVPAVCVCNAGRVLRLTLCACCLLFKLPWQATLRARRR